MWWWWCWWCWWWWLGWWWWAGVGFLYFFLFLELLFFLGGLCGWWLTHCGDVLFLRIKCRPSIVCKTIFMLWYCSVVEISIDSKTVCSPCSWHVWHLWIIRWLKCLDTFRYKQKYDYVKRVSEKYCHKLNRIIPNKWKYIKLRFTHLYSCYETVKRNNK